MPLSIASSIQFAAKAISIASPSGKQTHSVDGLSAKEGMKTNRNPTAILLSPSDLINSSLAERQKLNPGFIVSSVPAPADIPNWVSVKPGG